MASAKSSFVMDEEEGNSLAEVVTAQKQRLRKLKQGYVNL